MHYKECIKAKCEYLARTILEREYWCLDCNSELSRVCNCGIVDDYYVEKVKDS